MSSLRLLKTFLAVAHDGSFAGAAQRVALTQAAVGLQMRTLEGELRRPLFERTGKTVRLNQAGRELLPQAERMVALFEQMRMPAQSPRAMEGTLHLGAVVSALRPLLQATLALKRHHPGLDLHVSAAKSGELLSRMASGELDAAIAVHEPGAERAHAGLAWTPLYAEPMVVLAPRRWPEQPIRALVQGQPFIRFDRQEHTGQLVDRTLRRLRARPQELLELNAIETIVDLVRAGLGATMVPQLRDSRWASDPKLRVLEIPGAAEARQIALVQPRTGDKAWLIGAVCAEFEKGARPVGRARAAERTDAAS
ncbi:MAG: LysR family transcriptional regulator [Rhodoferax sp.]|nr:LysR family transcriptional regulator [Rhodoferax sp.]